jgi:hypothetical protein
MSDINKICTTKNEEGKYGKEVQKISYVRTKL